MTETPHPRSTLILGGARSGKSAFAENMATNSGLNLVYLATGQAYDGEMQDRISKHQTSRGNGWHTIEEPLKLLGILQAEVGPDRIILVDCLTLWISNLMMADKEIETEIDNLCSGLKDLRGPVLFVSNEVGQGIVPDNAMARAFRDHAGRLHQAIATQVEAVYFITAGLSQKLK